MMFFCFFISCMKSFDLSGQLRDTNGKPVDNAIVAINAAQLQTRSDSKGIFSFQINYKKSNGPYILTVQALAHQSKEQDLLLELETKKELNTKIILEPKKIFLPYRKVNIDYVSNEALQKVIESGQDSQLEHTNNTTEPSSPESSPEPTLDSPIDTNNKEEESISPSKETQPEPSEEEEE